MTAQATEPAGTGHALSAVPYSRILYIPRHWLWKDHIQFGGVTLFAASGGTGKGHLLCAAAARAVLGLPFPNEDQAHRYAPVSVLWSTGASEDDPWSDMAPRLRAAIRYAVAGFGLDPELAGEGERGAIHLVHALNTWRGGVPVSYPGDLARVRAEVSAIEAESARNGRPPVGLLVADSLSALLTDGYTINSRQGATRVMTAFADFARDSGAGVVLVHHLTQDGKVAGSPAVLDSLRLAYLVKRDKDNPDVRTVTQHKANAGGGDPTRYVITGDTPDTHAEFELSTDPVADTIAAAVRDAAPDGNGALRAPLAAGGPAVPVRAPAPARDTEGAPFRVLCAWRPPGADKAEPGSYVGPPYATRTEAYDAANRHAGRVLDWRQVGARPGMDATFFARDGGVVSYGILPKGPVKPAG